MVVAEVAEDGDSVGVGGLRDRSDFGHAGKLAGNGRGLGALTGVAQKGRMAPLVQGSFHSSPIRTLEE